MGYWKCKNCGGKIKITISRYQNEDYNISKNGNPEGKCLKKIIGEIVGENFYCKKCEKWFEDDEKIHDIAEWVEE